MTKPTKWPVRPAKTQISLGIRPVWSESSLSVWRKLWPLANQWVPSEDSDQTGWMPRSIWVLDGHTGHFVGFLMLRLISVSGNETFFFWENYFDIPALVACRNIVDHLDHQVLTFFFWEIGIVDQLDHQVFTFFFWENYSDIPALVACRNIVDQLDHQVFFWENYSDRPALVACRNVVDQMDHQVLTFPFLGE